MKKISLRHRAVLAASRAISETGSVFINTQDAEECVDLGLVEPGSGYPLTEKGKAVLEEEIAAS